MTEWGGESTERKKEKKAGIRIKEGGREAGRRKSHGEKQEERDMEERKLLT